MAIVQDGGEPMNVLRDPTTNVCIELPNEAKARPWGCAPGEAPARPGRTKLPAWMNPAPWAGFGLKYYLDRVNEESDPTPAT